MDLELNIRSTSYLRHAGIAILAAICLLLASGCNQEDRQAPNVTISSPAADFSAEATADLVISGTATDDEGLGQIVASLSDKVTGVYVSTLSVPLSGISDNFSFEFSLGTRYSPAGEYNLKLTVHDAAGNTSSEFFTVTLSELPMQRLGVLFGVEDGGFHYIEYHDTNGYPTAGAFMGPDFSFLEIDNRNQLVLAGHSAPGVLEALYPDDLRNAFVYQLPYVLAESFQEISQFRNDYYVSSAEPPYLQVFGPGGERISTFTDVMYPGGAVLATEERVFLAVKGANGTPVKLDAYHRGSKALQMSNPLGWEVTTLAEAGVDYLFAGGGQQAEILEKSSLNSLQRVQLPGELLDADWARDRLVLLLTNGFYTLDPASGNLNGPIVSGNFFSLAYDGADNLVWLGRAGMVEVFTLQGGLQAQIPILGNPVEIALHMNK